MTWTCAGIQVEFDREVELRLPAGLTGAHGVQPAFKLANDVTRPPCTPILWTNCSACPCTQPLALGPVLSDRSTVQLNVTYVSGRPGQLKYGWRDYPLLVVYSTADDRPAPPFNVTVPYHSANAL